MYQIVHASVSVCARDPSAPTPRSSSSKVCRGTALPFLPTAGIPPHLSGGTERRRRIDRLAVAGRYAQFRMIERRALEAHTVVRESLEERDQRGELIIVQVERPQRREGADRIRELVLRAMIGVRLKMARRARHAAVASGLHVPEQRLAQDDQRVGAAHVLRDAGRLGDGNLFE
jgi:hypothetical protein